MISFFRRYKKFYYLIAVLIILISVMATGFHLYSFFKKGKYLPETTFELIETPYLSDNSVNYCLSVDRFNLKSRLDENYKRIVINTQEDYQKFIDKSLGMHYDACKNLVFPSIDFSTKTLIGTDGAAWCRAHLTRDLRRDDKNKLYRYIIEEKLNCIPFIGCGARSCVDSHSLNLAIIPKMKDNYDIQFEFYPAIR